jgi:alkanesulfonate monooxygenase SsuD/methylene tetrahydromethanopterin reductase-like flavin-dependent oxidoreductase (luciferase family)
MEFGMFHEFPSLPGRSESEAFDEAMEQVDAAERLGLDVMWLAELHFEPRRSLLSAPLSIASAIAARTRRIKIGIAVQVLPLCHPLRLAEEAATVDQLSHGRLIFGVGRSGVAQTYEAYGCPMPKAATVSAKSSTSSSKPGPSRASRTTASITASKMSR